MTWLKISTIILCLLYGSTFYGQTSKRNVTDITINNSFRVGAELEVKCDHIAGKGYSYYKRIVVPGKENRMLRVPQGLRNCEIWVLKIFLLGGK